MVIVERLGLNVVLELGRDRGHFSDFCSLELRGYISFGKEKTFGCFTIYLLSIRQI